MLQPIKKFAASTRHRARSNEIALFNTKSAVEKSFKDLQQQLAHTNAELKASVLNVSRLLEEVHALKVSHSSDMDSMKVELADLNSRIVLLNDVCEAKNMAIVVSQSNLPPPPPLIPSASTVLPCIPSPSAHQNSVVSVSRAGPSLLQSSVSVKEVVTGSDLSIALACQCDDVLVSLNVGSSYDITAIQEYLRNIPKTAASIASYCINDPNCPLYCSVSVMTSPFAEEWFDFAPKDGACLLYSVLNALAVAAHEYSYSFHSDDVELRKIYLQDILGDTLEECKSLLASSDYHPSVRDSDGIFPQKMFISKLFGWFSSKAAAFAHADYYPDFDFVTLLVPLEKISQWLSQDGRDCLMRTQFTSDSLDSSRFSPATILSVLQSECHIHSRGTGHFYFSPIDPSTAISFQMALNSLLSNVRDLHVLSRSSLLSFPKLVINSGRTVCYMRPKNLIESGCLEFPKFCSKAISKDTSDMSDSDRSVGGTRKSSRIANLSSSPCYADMVRGIPSDSMEVGVAASSAVSAVTTKRSSGRQRKSATAD